MAIRVTPQEDGLEATYEINVTPFIDVMLVLLIVFMVAAPLSTVDINVDLPASTAELAPRPNKPLFLTIKPDLTLVLGETPIDKSALPGALDAQTQGDTQERIFVRADRLVPYGEVMEVMNLLRAAGYLKIGLVGLEQTKPRSSEASGLAAAKGQSPVDIPAGIKP